RRARAVPRRCRSDGPWRRLARFRDFGHSVIIAARLAGSTLVDRTENANHVQNAPASLAVWPLISVFFDIALHRRGPEALPASHALLRFALVAYGVVLLATLSVVPMTQAQLLVIVVRPAVDI